MNSLFDDLKQGLEEAIDLQKSVGTEKTDMNMPIRKYSKEEKLFHLQRLKNELPNISNHRQLILL